MAVVETEGAEEMAVVDKVDIFACTFERVFIDECKLCYRPSSVMAELFSTIFNVTISSKRICIVWQQLPTMLTSLTDHPITT